MTERRDLRAIYAAAEELAEAVAANPDNGRRHDVACYAIEAFLERLMLNLPPSERRYFVEEFPRLLDTLQRLARRVEGV